MARGSPFCSPEGHGEDEEEEEEDVASEESEESKKSRYLHRTMDECSDPERSIVTPWPWETEETEDTGPNPINWEIANANQRRKYEDEVMEHGTHNEFEEAELRRHADDLEYL